MLKVKVGGSSAISPLTSCMEGIMLLGTTLDISFDEKVFLLIVACNLFHKAAFMNLMFSKHCRINMLGLKCKTSLVITLRFPRKSIFIDYWMWFVSQTWYHEFQCSYEPVLKLCSDLSLNLSLSLRFKNIKSTFFYYQQRSKMEFM